MENLDLTSSAAIQLQGQSVIDLKETARWARFLSIVGFVFCALMVIMAFFVGAIFSSMSSRISMGFMHGMGAAFGVIYIVLAIIYFFPCLYLYRFSTGMLHSIDANNPGQVEASVRSLKSFFKFIGILTIICLAAYALALVGMIIAAAMR